MLRVETSALMQRLTVFSSQEDLINNLERLFEKMNLIKHKKLYFLISGIVIIPGLISLILFGLRPSIDFTGGSRFEIEFEEKKDTSDIEAALKKENAPVVSVRSKEENIYIVRTETLTQKQKGEISGVIKKIYPNSSELSFETVGATIGRETTMNALYAVLIASGAILLYIAFAFRHVSKPVSSWKFGLCAIAALIHDVLVVVGVFSILGYFLHVEVDSLFITALLTVMGFSVHDTIVVFDRIRENLKKHTSVSFEVNVNNSILETLNRSINTSITVVLVLFMLLLFGGESIRWFVAALLIGMVAGTYSSIFNASQLLVVWYEFDKKRRKSQT